MLKTSYLLAGVGILSLMNNSIIMNSDLKHSWRPDWMEKKITVQNNSTKQGIKEGHDKWEITLSIKDLNLPKNVQAIQLKSLNFSYELWFNVFKKWYDSSGISLNRDELDKATMILSGYDMLHDKLTFWVEGWNWFTNLQVKTSIKEIPSAFSDLHYGDAVNSYDIYNFKTDITYKYLLKTNDNNILKDNLYNFLTQEYDWNLAPWNTYQDVLNLAIQKIRQKIPSNLRDQISLELINKDEAEKNISQSHFTLEIKAVVFGEEITYNPITNDALRIIIKDVKSYDYNGNIIHMLGALKEINWKIDVGDINERYLDLNHFQLTYHVANFFSEWANKYFALDNHILHQHFDFHTVAHFIHNENNISTKLETKNGLFLGTVNYQFN